MTEYIQHIVHPLKIMGMFSLVAILTACGGGGSSSNSFTQPVTESKPQSSGDGNLSSSAQTKSLDSIKLSSSSSLSSKSSSKSNAASSRAIDTTPPVLAEDITVLSALSDRVAMEWTPATDNVGVVSYKIYRNQVQIDVLPGTQDDYIDFNVSPNKSYSYSITAGDAAGNWSTVKTIKVQTPAVVVQSSLSSAARSSSVSSSIMTSSSISSGVSSSSRSGTSNSSTSSLSSRSSLASSTQSSSASSLNTNSVNGDVTLKWTAPAYREDGNRLYATEIGGYEIRYISSSSDDSYTYLVVDDGAANSYTLHGLAGNYTFEISAYDTDNLYSNFTPISPR